MRLRASRPRWALPATVLLAGLCAGRALAAPPEHRFALLVGENVGLPEEERLRYAQADAQRMRQVLVELGGVAESDAVLLTGARADTVRGALRALEPRLAAARAAGEPSRLFVFVSSHAGDGVLHLDGSELPLSELVSFVKAAPVDVGLLVVDACRSGVVTRQKGLKPLEGPPVKLEAAGVKGRVFISASGADEYAQESEALQGSYFTHHFITGLRGAADSSRDGRVTLEEAYAWAWARTLEATFGSRAGTQRPAFSVDLEGQGQLVLAEPGAAAGRLTFAVQAPGQWLVVAEQSGAVVAEVEKGVGPLTLALPAGAYRVRLRAGDGVLERRLVVPEVGAALVRGEDLERASSGRVALKGAPEATLVFSAGGGVSSGLVGGVAVQPGLELRLRREARLLGPFNALALALAGRTALSESAAFRQTELELKVGTGYRLLLGRFSVSLLGELGPLLILQTQLPDGSGRTSLGLAFEALLELRLRLVGPLELFANGLLGGAVVKRVRGVGVVPRGAGTLGLAVGF